MKFKAVITLTVLVATVVGMSSFMPKAEDKKANNLKVLPKDISHEDLEKVMRGFNKSLGVRCNFCHSPQKDDPKRMDFASDAKPEKDVARMMMRMTAKINKKYFHSKDGGNPTAVMAISCITCHNGNAQPVSN
jgi:formate-dependent nitrite reductase cytochrome c552 subunit